MNQSPSRPRPCSSRKFASALTPALGPILTTSTEPGPHATPTFAVGRSRHQAATTSGSELAPRGPDSQTGRPATGSTGKTLRPSRAAAAATAPRPAGGGIGRVSALVAIPAHAAPEKPART
jgi:hypothetical protein